MTDIPARNWIGGQWVDPAGSDPAFDDVLDPATGEVIFRAASSTAADVDAAVASAATAFETWSTTTPRQRSEALLRLAQASRTTPASSPSWSRPTWASRSPPCPTRWT